MHPEFIKWLSKQQYRVYTGDPLNDDTSQDWIIDEVIESSMCHGVWTWEIMVRIELEWKQNEQRFL